MSLIKIKGLNKTYHKADSSTVVLNNIDLEINEGELVAIVGSSGSGKSTLINIIAGLDTNWTGDYYFDGNDMGDCGNEEWAKIRNRYFGFIFQLYNLIPYLSCLENIKLPLSYFNSKNSHYSNSIVETMRRLNIEEVSFNKPSELSGGQQQRVSIARALANKPRILLADEPTGALDVQNSNEVIKILKEINNEGTTVVIVTHDINIAELCDRKIEISDGKVIDDVNENTNLLGKFHSSKEDNICNKNFLYRVKCVLRNSLFLYMKNKTKLFLSLIGVIVGIATVVFILSISESFEKQIISELAQMGNSTVQAESYEVKNGLLNESSFGKLVNLKDIEHISPYLREHKELNQYFKNPKKNNFSNSSTIFGVSSEFESLINLQVLSGRLISPRDVEFSESVIVINDVLNTQFFDSEGAIGKKVVIDNVVFYVIGVVKQTDLRSPQSIAWIPYSTFINRISDQDFIDSFHFTVVKPESEKLVIDYLSKLTNDSYTFWSDQEYIDTLYRVKNSFSVFILSIASISLFVGGSGIMNIMLASVNERYSEIGLRRAIGASKKDILEQFLVESLFITLLGGFLGVLLSVVTLLIIKNILTEFDVILSISSIFIGVAFSFFTGLLFGLLPATKASNLNPIEALSR